LRKQLAEQKCEALKTEICTKYTACAAPPGQPPSITFDECRQQVSTGLNCGLAVGVSASYDRCISETQASSCSVWLYGGSIHQPASCEHVLLK
jgi:hypothetical protein